MFRSNTYSNERIVRMDPKQKYGYVNITYQLTRDLVNEIMIKPISETRTEVVSNKEIKRVNPYVIVNEGVKHIDSIDDVVGNGCVWFYSLRKENNSRTGIVMASWDPTVDNVKYTLTQTMDIGDTSDVSLSVEIVANKVKLVVTSISSGWVFNCRRMAL